MRAAPSRLLPLAATLAAFATADVAAAQQLLEPLFPGSRVRITTNAESRRVVGTLAATTPDSVVITDRTRQALARQEIARVEASRGRARWKWALGGAIVGAVLGAATAGGENPRTDFDIYEEEYEVLGPGYSAVFVGLAAAGLGAAGSPPADHAAPVTCARGRAPSRRRPCSD